MSPGSNTTLHPLAFLKISSGFFALTLLLKKTDLSTFGCTKEL